MVGNARERRGAEKGEVIQLSWKQDSVNRCTGEQLERCNALLEVCTVATVLRGTRASGTGELGQL